MATTRINGVPVKLGQLSELQLETLASHVENRRTQAVEDLKKVMDELASRADNVLPFPLPRK